MIEDTIYLLISRLSTKLNIESMKRLEGRILLLKMKHCQRHNGPRLLSLRLELSLLLKKYSFSTLSLCPLLSDHLFHLVHLLAVHHHLNDNHHHPNGPTTYIVANIITAPTFHATPAPPCRPPWSLHNCPICLESRYIPFRVPFVDFPINS